LIKCFFHLYVRWTNHHTVPLSWTSPTPAVLPPELVFRLNDTSSPTPIEAVSTPTVLTFAPVDGRRCRLILLSYLHQRSKLGPAPLPSETSTVSSANIVSTSPFFQSCDSVFKLSPSPANLTSASVPSNLLHSLLPPLVYITTCFSPSLPLTVIATLEPKHDVT